LVLGSGNAARSRAPDLFYGAEVVAMPNLPLLQIRSASSILSRIKVQSVLAVDAAAHIDKEAVGRSTLRARHAWE
jgi:hypothetical protein